MASYELPQLWLPLFLIFPLLLLMKKKINARKQNLHYPPGPPRLPIIGNLHQLGDLPHSSMWHLSKKYGPVMVLQLGSVPIIVISSAEAAREVLKVHDLASCSRPSSSTGAKRLSYNYLDVAFTPYGDYWREMRKICVLEVFSIKRVKSYQLIREEEVDSLISSIAESASSTTPVDLTDKIFTLTASVIFRIAFGTRFRASDFHHDRFHEVVHEAEAMLGGYQSSEYFPYVGWIIDKLTGLNQRLERIFHELDSFFQQVIDDHLDPGRTKPEHEDIIDVLLGIEREQAELGVVTISKDNIKAVLLNMFLGGVDTGAITMIWAMAELARKPNVMRKAQEEVRSLVGNKGKVTESNTEQLQYLKMVVKETLRLHPPAPLLLPRETMSYFNLCGYDMFPKTLIQINFWAIGRDPQNWKNPEEFIPERFADSSIDFKGQHFEYLPFGAGRRGCPGIYMATTTIELALANMLYSFDWKLPDGMKEKDLNMEETSGLSLTVSKKIPLHLVPAKPLPT